MVAALAPLMSLVTSLMNSLSHADMMRYWSFFANPSATVMCSTPFVGGRYCLPAGSDLSTMTGASTSSLMRACASLCCDLSSIRNSCSSILPPWSTSYWFISSDRRFSDTSMPILLIRFFSSDLSSSPAKHNTAHGKHQIRIAQ
jgi:hypothetical protein